MARMQDRPLLFSLKHATCLDESAVRKEIDLVRARAEVEQRGAHEASMLSRLAFERKARQEAERRADEAHIAAIRVAAVERARVDIEVKARVEALRIAEEHERALAVIRGDEWQKAIGRALHIAAAGVAILLIGAAGLWFGVIEPAASARLRAQQADIAAAREEAARLRAELAKRDDRIRAAERALGASARPPGGSSRQIE